MDVDVPLLEAAFIEPFSEKGLSTSRLFFFVPNCESLLFSYRIAVWSLEDLITSVGSIEPLRHYLLGWIMGC